MSFLITGAGAASVGLSGAGLYALRSAWIARGSNRAFTLLGWALLIAAIIGFAIAGGPDRGVAMGMIIISFMALGVIGFGAIKDGTAAPKAPRTPRLSYRNKAARPSIARLVLAAMTGAIMVGPVCAITAFVTALGLHEIMTIMGAHASNSLVAALFVFPIAWAALASFALISTRIIAKAALFISLIVLSGALLYFGNGGVL